MTIYNNNLNGFSGKKASIGALLETIKPTVVTFQETALTGNNQLKVKNYSSFQRNRKGTKIMGGVATLVANQVKAHAVKVKEGEDDDEFLITRLGHVVPAVNILNIYGGIESRMSKQKVLENWVRVMKEINLVRERNEGLIIIGDLNRAVGSVIEGNSSTVSPGGQLVRDLLEQEQEGQEEEEEHKKEYFLLNSSNIAEGGPWTWVSRADSSIRSCIDLCIVSANLMPYVTKVVIDSKQLFCAKKVVRSAGKEKLIRSDHYPLIVSLENIPLAKVSEPKESFWNVLKPGGWDIYKDALEEETEKIKNIIENKNISEEEVMKKIDTITDKVKFKAFGKSKPITLKAEQQRLETRLKAAQGLDGEQAVKDLMRKQYDSMEREINKLKEGKFGRVTNILKMKDIVTGSKKMPQEASAVYDVEKKELVVSNEDIKRVTLKHCMNTLKNKTPDKDVEDLVKLINKVHEKRMVEEDDEQIEVSKEDFDCFDEKASKKEQKKL